MDFISSEISHLKDNGSLNFPLDSSFLFENSSLLTFIMDDQAEVRWINNTWERVFSLTRADFFSSKENIFSLFMPSCLREFKKSWMIASHKRTSFFAEIRLMVKKNEWHWYKITVDPVIDNYSKRISWMAILTDINSYKKHEYDLQLSLKSKDEFISVASHELKTPLTTLMLQAQVIKRSIEKGESFEKNPQKINNLLNTIEKQTRRLNRLIEDMLDISRIRTGQLSIKKSQLDLCDLLRDVFEKMAEQNPNLSHLMSYQLHVKQLFGFWDRIRLEQVITNLMSNAMKYGEGRPFSIELFSSSSHAILKIKDHGIGIPQEKLKAIFKRYERADVSELGISGLGLGLYISEQIVLAHGGRIWAESDKGEGATFFMALPLSNTP